VVVDYEPIWIGSKLSVFVELSSKVITKLTYWKELLVAQEAMLCRLSPCVSSPTGENIVALGPALPQPRVEPYKSDIESV
jgi:hypothetical protein